MNLFASITQSIVNLLNRFFPTQPAAINPQFDLMYKRQVRFHSIHQKVGPNRYRTRPGRHPLESRSKYTGSGALK